MSLLPSLYRQELLVDGFCNIYYKDTLPIMLIKLIFSMYNEIYYWKFKDEKLKQFLSTSNSQRKMSKPMIMKGINVAYCLYPKGYQLLEGVRFGICILEMDSNIDYIVTNQIICSKECNTYSIYSSKSSKITNEYEQPTVTLMKSKYFKNINDITFMTKIDLITIKPKDINNKTLSYHKPGIKLSKNVHFEWIFDDELITRVKTEFSNHLFRKWYNSNFFDNNNWSMELYQLYMGQNAYFFGFKIYQFPKGIEQIKFKYFVKFDYNDRNLWTSHKTGLWTYSNIHQSTGKTLHFDHEMISGLKTFKACIDIEIVEMYDMKHVSIPQMHWGKYGII
eukprot:65783_1